MRSSQSNRPHDRYSARNMSKPINFFCVAPEAETVSVVGDFNDWHANHHPMERQADGSWHLRVPLHHGHHHYHFWSMASRCLTRGQWASPEMKKTSVSR